MIRLNDDYFINTDDDNYILCRDSKRIDKKGNRVYKVLGYFGRIQELLDYWAERSVNERLVAKDELSLNEAVKIIREELENTRQIVRKAIPDISTY